MVYKGGPDDDMTREEYEEAIRMSIEMKQRFTKEKRGLILFFINVYQYHPIEEALYYIIGGEYLEKIHRIIVIKYIVGGCCMWKWRKQRISRS